jgi:hypothetical protein
VSEICWSKYVVIYGMFACCLGANASVVFVTVLNTNGGCFFGCASTGSAVLHMSAATTALNFLFSDNILIFFKASRFPKLIETKNPILRRWALFVIWLSLVSPEFFMF